MAHLRKVGIRGYRSITNQNLRLGEITVIIGPSDCGKSNVVRALRDWAFNVSGHGFVTLGAQQARIAVAVKDDLRVMFEKSVRNKKGASRYVVQDAEAEKSSSYEKIGVTVPPEVSDVTGIREVEIDKDLRLKIQFSMQDEQGFLLASGWTPGRVAKVIGKISGVDALILAQRDLIQQRNEQRRQLKEATTTIETSQEALRATEWVVKAREDLDRAREVERRLEGRRRSLRVAEDTIKKLRTLRTRQAGLRDRYSLLKQFAMSLVESDYEASAAALAEAELLRGQLDELHRKKADAAPKLEEIRARLAEAADQLRQEAKRGAECPLCGQGAHEGCLEGLAREAEEAAR